MLVLQVNEINYMNKYNYYSNVDASKCTGCEEKLYDVP